MEIQQLEIDQLSTPITSKRPESFGEIIGQKHVTSVLQTAIQSAQQRQESLGHVLLFGPSGFGKTTLAHVIAQTIGRNFKPITGYALSKPADLISLLNALEENDILFIDEIHRLKPSIEEVLYIAMEDFVIDMMMPDGASVRIPLRPFTLVGATTKPEALTPPLKNRFVYTFHLMEYADQEKYALVKKYLHHYNLDADEQTIGEITRKIDAVPRKIHNLCIKIRDFMTLHGDSSSHITPGLRTQFVEYLQLDDGGITPLHQKYLDILNQFDKAVGIKTIAGQLGINEKAIEEDIEPLLFKLGKIQKTSQGRILNA